MAGVRRCGLRNFGAGRMGLRHLEVVRSMKLDLVGICDVSRDALRCAGERGAAETTHFADAATMRQQVKPECVIVATTAPSHAICRPGQPGGSSTQTSGTSNKSQAKFSSAATWTDA